MFQSLHCDRFEFLHPADTFEDRLLGDARKNNVVVCSVIGATAGLQTLGIVAECRVKCDSICILRGRNTVSRLLFLLDVGARLQRTRVFCGSNDCLSFGEAFIYFIILVSWAFLRIFEKMPETAGPMRRPLKERRTLGVETALALSRLATLSGAVITIGVFRCVILSSAALTRGQCPNLRCGVDKLKRFGQMYSKSHKAYEGHAKLQVWQLQVGLEAAAKWDRQDCLQVVLNSNPLIVRRDPSEGLLTGKQFLGEKRFFIPKRASVSVISMHGWFAIILLRISVVTLSSIMTAIDFWWVGSAFVGELFVWRDVLVKLMLVAASSKCEGTQYFS